MPNNLGFKLDLLAFTLILRTMSYKNILGAETTEILLLLQALHHIGVRLRKNFNDFDRQPDQSHLTTARIIPKLSTLLANEISSILDQNAIDSLKTKTKMLYGRMASNELAIPFKDLRTVLYKLDEASTRQQQIYLQSIFEPLKDARQHLENASRSFEDARLNHLLEGLKTLTMTLEEITAHLLQKDDFYAQINPLKIPYLCKEISELTCQLTAKHEISWRKKYNLACSFGRKWVGNHYEPKIDNKYYLSLQKKIKTTVSIIRNYFFNFFSNKTISTLPTKINECSRLNEGVSLFTTTWCDALMLPVHRKQSIQTLKI
ncbi:hypothetical protein [Candidiatus Paracoxiella cheracis]|uniref:hypothetical protein n=1 Tax=Candidiatus Paracoxiella cheracis TaxID=3405120 RepID=UPI003BF529B6